MFLCKVTCPFSIDRWYLPPLESVWAFDCFSQWSVVGVMLWVRTGNSASALSAGMLAFRALGPPCREEGKPHGLATCRCSGQRSRFQVILAQVPIMGMKQPPEDASLRSLNHPQFLSLLSWALRHCGAESMHPFYALSKLLTHRIHKHIKNDWYFKLLYFEVIYYVAIVTEALSFKEKFPWF